jgi:hypothetical protein
MLRAALQALQPYQHALLMRTNATQDFLVFALRMTERSGAADASRLIKDLLSQQFFRQAYVWSPKEAPHGTRWNADPLATSARLRDAIAAQARVEARDILVDVLPSPEIPIPTLVPDERGRVVAPRWDDLQLAARYASGVAVFVDPALDDLVVQRIAVVAGDLTGTLQ